MKWHTLCQQMRHKVNRMFETERHFSSSLGVSHPVLQIYSGLSEGDDIVRYMSNVLYVLICFAGRPEATGARRRRNLERGAWVSAPLMRYCQTAPKVSVIIIYIYIYIYIYINVYIYIYIYI